MYKTILVFLVSLALLGFASTATAQDHVGLSGQCYNGDASEGGEDELRVYSNGEVVLFSGTDPTNPTSAGLVPALSHFATESVNDGNTGNACKRYDCKKQSDCPDQEPRYDYLEASVKVGGLFLQACYDGGAQTHGECPTSPTGPGGSNS